MGSYIMTIFWPIMIIRYFIFNLFYHNYKTTEWEVKNIFCLKIIKLIIKINKLCKKYSLKYQILPNKKAIKVFKDTNNSLYFIIILSQNTVNTKIGRIKNTNTTDYKSIILLTKEIKYEKLFSGHLELYGAIDLTEDLDVLMKEINEYLTEWLKFPTKKL